MKLVVFVNTPAQLYEFQYIIKTLKEKGHNILVLARDYDITIKLIEHFKISYKIYGKARGAGYRRLLARPMLLIKAYCIARSFKPDLIIGLGEDVSFLSLLLKKKGIMFNDSEPSPIEAFLHWPFNVIVLTPTCFKRDLGKKQIRYDGYKELAYLHPNYFIPNPNIYEELGIIRNESYVILRFNAFSASHDIGRSGFSLQDKQKLVRGLEKYVKVFISSEKPLPKDLEPYIIPINPSRIHHALYYAQMIVSDTGTMTTESAVLGTPAIMCLSNVPQFGNFTELEETYGLISTFSSPDKAVQKAIEMIRQPNLKESWKKKREVLLADKIDVTQFAVELIESILNGSNEYLA